VSHCLALLPRVVKLKCALIPFIAEDLVGPSMSDAGDEYAALLCRARRGDTSALTQLASQYESKVRLVARVLLGPALRPYLDSMDLVQSVHRSLLVGLRVDKFDISSPEKLLGLALTMVRRKVARQWRHLQRQRRLAGGSMDSSNLPDLLTSLCSRETAASDTVQFNDSVAHLCNNLDPSERRVIEMRLQGFSTAEIAGELDLQAVTLRVRLTRLRKRLEASGVLTDWL
jgi:RNA polymerase sigma factor (sigma-70 family)